jgi:Lon-like ATP-dependent protease
VESQEPPANESNEVTSEENSSKESGEPKIVTTQDRKPLKIPDNIHVRITPENLKDYVGPPVYHKDRMYVNPPPPGVSTGLGYLGNGSGAVMPVEATVRSISFPLRCKFTQFSLSSAEHAW